MPAPTIDPPSTAHAEVHRPLSGHDPTTPAGPSSDPSRGRWGARGYAAEPFAVFLIALVARLPFLDHIPHKDELNHVLAARAYLERGTFEIVAGGDPYDRASGFTYLVSGMFRFFGESLVVARLPSVLFGALIAVVLFLWIRAEAGRIGAWAAAGLIIFSPVALMLSQWTRFYTLKALFLTLACLLVYRALQRPGRLDRRELTMLVAAAGVIGLSLHFQIATLSILPGLAIWMAAFGGVPLLRGMRSQRARIVTVAAVALVLGLAAAVLISSGTAAHILAVATAVDGWAEDHRGNVRYYHAILLEQYPPLWTLFPLAILVAAARYFRLATFFACVFGITFLIHSVLPWKTERYIFHVLPLFFGLWGLAIAAALPWLRRSLDLVARRATGRRLSRRAREVAVFGTLGIVAAFAAVGSAATSYAVKYMTVGDANWRGGWGGYRGNPDWVALGDHLRDEIATAEAVVVSSDVSGYYALGRVDYLLRRMTRDKVGAPAASTGEEIATLIACTGSGIIVIERTHYGRDWAVPREITDYLEARLEAVELPEAWRLFAFRWTEPSPSPEAAPCEARA